MPLIIITGLPCSGKSTRAKQLHDYLAERIAAETTTTSSSNPKYRLHLISDQTQSISRTVYDLSPEKLPAHVRSANASEKDARAALYGAVKRVLSPRDIVILDGLNYIKGWRYQLFCEAKNMRTPSAVLQIGCTPDRARQVNAARLARQKRTVAQSSPQPISPDDQPNQPQDPKPEAEAEAKAEESILSKEDDQDPYSESNLENLIFRYEEPNPMTRWDSPLFTLIWEDDVPQTKATFSKLWDVLAGEAKKTIRPNLSTMQRDKDPGGDYLYLLERETQNIVKAILEAQGEDGGAGDGQRILLPRNGKEQYGEDEQEEQQQLVVELPAQRVGLPQLQRHRRAFVALNRGGIGLEAVGKLAVGRLRESFVGYLNDVFDKEG